MEDQEPPQAVQEDTSGDVVVSDSDNSHINTDDDHDLRCSKETETEESCDDCKITCCNEKISPEELEILRTKLDNISRPKGVNGSSGVQCKVDSNKSVRKSWFCFNWLARWLGIRSRSKESLTATPPLQISTISPEPYSPIMSCYNINDDGLKVVVLSVNAKIMGTCIRSANHNTKSMDRTATDRKKKQRLYAVMLSSGKVRFLPLSRIATLCNKVCCMTFPNTRSARSMIRNYSVHSEHGNRTDQFMHCVLSVWLNTLGTAKDSVYDLSFASVIVFLEACTEYCEGCGLHVSELYNRYVEFNMWKSLSYLNIHISQSIFKQTLALLDIDINDLMFKKSWEVYGKDWDNINYFSSKMLIELKKKTKIEQKKMV